MQLKSNWCSTSARPTRRHCSDHSAGLSSRGSSQLAQFPVISGATACRTCTARVAVQRLVCQSQHREHKNREKLDVAEDCLLTTSRRRLLAAAACATLPHLFAGPVSAEEDLVAFTDVKGIYSLQRPKDWEQVEKAGADALFKAPTLKSTDLGVTVSPVRIKRLDQLGDITAIGERLLAAERKKESTKSAELLGKSSQTCGSGTTFFLFDYTVSTTRGDKRILSKVGVADSSLYIVNASLKCTGESCKEDTALVDLARRSVASFDLKT